ncbi:MAG: hypothetical protein OEZ25_04430 [Candidatus Bathyarchaeota archaeon]|nr:hypothetical protein [Candidatus Bathyarchaeota archaeon]
MNRTSKEVFYVQKERLVREFFGKMFGKPLKKRKLVMGHDSKNKPQIHEFDLVSDDMSIIGEIKSGKKSKNNYVSGIADCLFLSRIQAKKKLFVLTDKDFYEHFKVKSEGVIPSDIEILYVCLEDVTREKRECVA